MKPKRRYFLWCFCYETTVVILYGSVNKIIMCCFPPPLFVLCLAVVFFIPTVFRIPMLPLCAIFKWLSEIKIFRPVYSTGGDWWICRWATRGRWCPSARGLLRRRSRSGPGGPTAARVEGRPGEGTFLPTWSLIGGGGHEIKECWLSELERQLENPDQPLTHCDDWLFTSFS